MQQCYKFQLFWAFFSLALWPANTYAEACDDSLKYSQVTIFKNHILSKKKIIIIIKGIQIMSDIPGSNSNHFSLWLWTKADTYSAGLLWLINIEMFLSGWLILEIEKQRAPNLHIRISNLRSTTTCYETGPCKAPCSKRTVSLALAVSPAGCVSPSELLNPSASSSVE